MNQSTNSLEDKLKARLQEYEAPPPPGAGGAILDQVNGESGSSPWGVTLALLLGVFLIGGGFYMASTEAGDETLTTANGEGVERAANQSNIAQASLMQPIKGSTEVETSTQSNSGRRVADTEDATEQSAGVSSVVPIQESVVNRTEEPIDNEEQLTSAVASVIPREDALNQETSTIPTVSRESSETTANLISNDEQIEDEAVSKFDQLSNKEVDLSGLSLASDELTISPYVPRSGVQPAKQKRYHLYGDLGVFFLYNHLQPNKDDGLIMENFETSGSFSLDRLSYYAEFGMRRDLSRRVTLRAAAVTNIFAQKYSFDIRDEASSSVQVSGADNNLLTPVFERQPVAMDHFLVSAGVRISTDLKVFNNDLNRLMLGLGYHHILNPEHTFEYNGETQRIEYPHQLTASFGFRKVVWQTERGELSLLPVLRYGLIHKASENSSLTIKPFSIGLTIGYGLK